MEIRKAIVNWKRTGCFCICTFLLLLLHSGTKAQLYTIRDGKMYIELPKGIDEKELDSFIVHFDLYDLSLKYFIKTNATDSLKMSGWKVEKNNEKMIAISKPMIGLEDLTDVAEKIIFTLKEPGIDALFPATNNGLSYGYNRFKNKTSFYTRDSVVTFFLRNYPNANQVVLAGSFNNWDEHSLQMLKTDSGWIADVKIGPGKYWYKFIADGRWMVDPDNQQSENDGKGNINSVFFKTNYTFKVDTFLNAKKVHLAGSFNLWNYKELLMQRTPSGWELPVYLADGTHTYRYIVDGKWQADPGNPERLPNEYNEFNSVVRLGKPHIFTLKGYENAAKVFVAGSFNGWRRDELNMKKTETGWEFPYTIGPGNYEYRFIVDGKEITDPANEIISNTNSYLIIDPNHTFTLKGYPDAKNVFLAGDFNNFGPNSLIMKKAGDEWVFSVHLSRGKHIYKFIVDNKWIRDPANDQWEQNSYGTGDSVIWME